MKKILFQWKTYLSLSILSLFLLLFFVLYHSLMQLPDSGFSRSIKIDSFTINKDIKDFSKANFCYTLHDDNIFIITSDHNALTINLYNSLGKKLETHRFDELSNYNHLASTYKDGILSIAGYNELDHTINRFIYNIKLSTIELVNTSEKIDSQLFSLTTEAFAYSLNDTVIISNYSHSTVIKAPHLKKIDLYEQGNLQALLLSNYEEQSYKLQLHLFDDSLNAIKKASPFFTFGSGNAFVPTESNLLINQDSLDLIAVIKDTKSGINNVYWFKTNMNDLSSYEIKNFIHFGYSVFPTLYNYNNKINLALSTNTEIGKIEIGSTKSVFQNIVNIHFDEIDQPSSITRSTQTSIYPEIFPINSHLYALYSRVDNGNVSLYLSSTHPDLILSGNQIQFNELINLLMTTLTTFLPLSYMALILEVYILTPVLLIIVFISMFKMTWSERNGGKLLILSLLIHFIAKFYFIITRIVQVPEVINNFPTFLNTPSKTLGFGLLFTSIAGVCLYDYIKKNPNSHYLKHYIFFNLIDILLFIMLYTPYYLI